MSAIRESKEYQEMPFKWQRLTYTEPESEEESLAFWQFLVDNGLCWILEGWFGRAASSMIEAGIIEPPK